MSLDRKLRILCLHGYRQDADLFRDKMGGFRKAVKSVAELVFISAPHPILEGSCANSAEGGVMNIKGGHSWWFCDDSGSFNSKMECKEAKGFEESIKVVSHAFDSQGPFDGILGFSQGGALAALICGLREEQKFPHDFQFVVIVAGFKSISRDHQYFYEKHINIPSLHIIGKNDTCIPKEYSEDLMSVFKVSSAVYHEGGHFVPTQSNIRKEYISFFKNMICCSVNEHK